MRELSFSGQPMTAAQIAKAIEYLADRTEIALERMEQTARLFGVKRVARQSASRGRLKPTDTPALGTENSRCLPSRRALLCPRELHPSKSVPARGKPSAVSDSYQIRCASCEYFWADAAVRGSNHAAIGRAEREVSLPIRIEAQADKRCPIELLPSVVGSAEPSAVRECPQRALMQPLVNTGRYRAGSCSTIGTERLAVSGSSKRAANLAP